LAAAWASGKRLSPPGPVAGWPRQDGLGVSGGVNGRAPPIGSGPRAENGGAGDQAGSVLLRGHRGIEEDSRLEMFVSRMGALPVEPGGRRRRWCAGPARGITAFGAGLRVVQRMLVEPGIGIDGVVPVPRAPDRSASSSASGASTVWNLAHENVQAMARVQTSIQSGREAASEAREATFLVFLGARPPPRSILIHGHDGCIYTGGQLRATAWVGLQSRPQGDTGRASACSNRSSGSRV
jgi:hypothetical protein